MSTSKIAAKLVSAMKVIDAVEKKGRNSQQSYNYVRATDVANEVRKALASEGIAFTYSVLTERFWDSPTKSGTIQFFCSLLVAVTFTDSESGESLTANCIGWGADSQEKAPYKAMTGALKYALRMNFLIPDESDPEDAVVHESVKAGPVRVGPKVVTSEQASAFREACKAKGLEQGFVVAALMKQGIKNTGQIPAEAYDEWMTWVEGAA